MIKRYMAASIALSAVLYGCDSKPVSNNAPVAAAANEPSKPALLNDPDYLKALKKAEQHVESKKEYIKSCQRVGSRKNAIYLKEFLKSPGKFTGTRVAIRGKILQIDEEGGSTGIQMYVNGNLDSVIVHYPESVKVYEGDIIQVYGEGAGTMDGVNRMGASMTWPVVQAKYVALERHADE